MKGIGKTQFVSELTIESFVMSHETMESFQRKTEIIKAWILILMWDCVSAIHPTHITIYSFWRTAFSSKVFANYQKKLHLNSKKWWKLDIFNFLLSLPLLWSETLDYITCLLLLRLILHQHSWAISSRTRKLIL